MTPRTHRWAAFLYSASLAATSAAWAAAPPSGSPPWVDAGVTVGGATYLFQGASYMRFHAARLDPGYPRPLAGGGWQGLPASFQQGIDAAVHAADRNKTYFFRGDQYLRLTGVSVDPGYPLTLPGGWEGLPPEFHDGIDAALYSNGHVYFFKGRRYVRFTGVRMDPGYPADLPGGWELPADLDRIDAAVAVGDKNFFFSGDHYLRLSGTRRDPGYPAELPGGWAGLPAPSGEATAVTVANAPAGPVAETFVPPTFGDHRIHACLQGKERCGQPAADAFCDSRDHGPAVSFETGRLVAEEVWLLGIGDVMPCGTCEALDSVACSLLPKPLPREQQDFLEIQLANQYLASVKVTGAGYEVGAAEVSWDNITQFHPGDFDGDGVDELARWGPDPGALIVTRFAADGSIAYEKQVAQTDGVWFLFAPGDFDGNGSDDLLEYDIGDRSPRMIRFDADLAPRISSCTDMVPTGPGIVLDATGDGRDDFLMNTELDHRLDLVVFHGGSLDHCAFDIRYLGDDWGTALRFAVGDFDGDGRDDLLVNDFNADEVDLVRFDSRGMIASRTLVASQWSGDLRWTRGFDYDADGRDELLVYDPRSGFGELVRLNPMRTLLERTRLRQFKDALFYSGYFRDQKRASVLINERLSPESSPLTWLQFDRHGQLALVTNVQPFVPPGSVIIVGDFFRD